jgi:hypothetical protein
MTLNPIPGSTLHNMLVEGPSMPAALKVKLKPILAPRVIGRAGRHFGIHNILRSSAVVTFWIEKFPVSLKVTGLFRKVLVAASFLSH